MFYYQVKEINNQVEVLCSSNLKLQKNDVVVIPDYNNEPATARVQKEVPPYKALVSPIEAVEIIDKVQIKEWEAKLKKEVENKVLFEKMQNKINEIKVLEQLEKFAGKDAEMSELLKEYKSHNNIDVEDSPQNEITTEY